MLVSHFLDVYHIVRMENVHEFQNFLRSKQIISTVNKQITSHPEFLLINNQRRTTTKTFRFAECNILLVYKQVDWKIVFE